ncbi:hypothetical protein [Oceanicola sp. S124]|uniref:hypothetical protein n=1 Tax=Oceanicola sp. S124 TaxID=1042378 RepID=UPI00031452D3|nr:hypothetical protein [Oceanicola sp. S124]
MAFLKRRGATLAQLPEAALEGVIRSVQQVNRLVHGHHEQRLEGRLLHVRAELDHGESGVRPELWQPLCAELELAGLPCLHGQMVSAAMVGRLAPLLQARMRAAEG